MAESQVAARGSEVHIHRFLRGQTSYSEILFYHQASGLVLDIGKTNADTEQDWGVYSSWSILTKEEQGSFLPTSNNEIQILYASGASFRKWTL
ncbi:hypothetical protein PoB_000600600 [Plakobranchus ocellatus]|uniref:Uncharacterized protein n=1 Tax=Plakobranchus ocellatus TaxID=259542 RepID=A0AAV3Y8F6_9GAST|nr:hypothetical protein PoB_000600600 [Plakobranchus ocellatus]